MPYCLHQDVRLLVDTALEDEEIEDLIELADEELDGLLGGASMSNQMKKACSMRLTAIMIVENQPESIRMGGLSMKYVDCATRWRKWVNLKVAKSVGRWHTVDALED